MTHTSSLDPPPNLKPSTRRRARVALILGVGVLVVMSVLGIALLAAGPESGTETSPEISTESNPQTSAKSADVTAVQQVETPCFTFDGPADYLNTDSAFDTSVCLSHLQLWGERDANGRILKTGFGSILGSVEVRSVLVPFSDELAPDEPLDSVVDGLNVEHIPALGTVISLKEGVTLDGMPANITRVTSHVATTKTKIMIASYAPRTYETAGGAVHLFLIYLVIPEDNGEEILASLLDSWRWT